ncbi:MAG: acyltransferase family protein [Janthinobacterium lividum]
MKEELKSLTGLRFLAALYVFVFHLDMPMRTPLTYLPWRVEAVIQQGRLGVTVFFVLSGFLLTYRHFTDFDSSDFKGVGYYLNFVYKRLVRVYPVFIVGFFVCLGISFGQGTLPHFPILLLSASLLQTYFPSVAMQWYDMGTWSVANEMFFYLLFPLALPLLLRIQRRSTLVRLLAALALVGTALGALSLLRPDLLRYQLAYSFPPSRFPEFVAGMLGGLLLFRFRWRAPVWLAVGLGSLTVVYLAVAGPLLASTLVHNWLVIPTLVVLLNVLSQPRQSPLFKWVGSGPMVYLGRISYSFYIAQHPLVFLLDPLIKSGQLDSHDWRIAPVALLVNLAGAVLLHELVEKKITVPRLAAVVGASYQNVVK